MDKSSLRIYSLAAYRVTYHMNLDICLFICLSRQTKQII